MLRPTRRILVVAESTERADPSLGDFDEHVADDLRVSRMRSSVLGARFRRCPPCGGRTRRWQRPRARLRPRKASPRDAVVADSHDQDAAFIERGTVRLGSRPADLDEDRAAIDRRAQELCAKVRDRAEQRRPIRAHLVDSLESACRMQGLLAAVVLVEAGKHAFEVVRVLRSRQPVDHGPRVCHRTERMSQRRRRQPSRQSVDCSTRPRLLRRGTGSRGLPGARGLRASLPQSGRVEAHLACAASGYRARPGKATTGADSCTGISAPP